MKIIIKSFLFFVLLLFSDSEISAQKIIDSTNYYIKLIEDPKIEGNLFNALNYFKKKQTHDGQINYDLGMVYDLTYIARAERRLGALNDSENSAIEALRILDRLDDVDNREYRISIYNHLGIISKELEKYDSALKYYDKLLGIELQPEKSATIFNNIGNVYFKQNKFESAISYYSRSYKQSLSLKDSLKMARSQSNLGLAQSKVNHPDALNNINEALQIRQEKEYQKGIVTSYLHLSEYYKNESEVDKAESYATKALYIAKKTNITDYKFSAFASVLGLSKDPNIKGFLDLNDSLNKANQKNENKYADNKYNYEKLEKKIQESKIVNEKQKQLKILYLLLATVIFLISVFAYYILKSRHKKQKLQEVYKTETRISKKVHDEVANDVYHIMTKLQGQSNIKEDVMDDLEDIYIKTRDISRENAAIHLEVQFNELLRDLLLSFKNDSVNVITKGLSKVNLNALSKEKKTVLYRVLQELMVNMRKHSQANYVIISFEELKGKISIEYKDNGVGCMLKKQNGLVNTENRMRSIKGTITFESKINKGFTAKLIV